MKHLLTIGLFGILLGVCTANAQEIHLLKKFHIKESQKEIVMKNCAMGLRSDNAGLISATLAFVAKMKLVDPTINVADLRGVVDSLSISHPSENVRYKAHLVSNVCVDPQWFLMDPNLSNVDDEQFFPTISHRLYNKLFGISSL